jgi:hypothetical protein
LVLEWALRLCFPMALRLCRTILAKEFSVAILD